MKVYRSRRCGFANMLQRHYKHLGRSKAQVLLGSHLPRESGFQATVLEKMSSWSSQINIIGHVTSSSPLGRTFLRRPLRAIGAWPISEPLIREQRFLEQKSHTRHIVLCGFCDGPPGAILCFESKG